MVAVSFPHFYKYVTAKTAKNILRSCTVKYSSPLTFNDPFDNQHKLAFPFTEKARTNAFKNILLGLWNTDSPVNGNIFAEALRSIPKISTLPKNELLEVVAKGQEETSAQFEQMVEKYCQKLQEEAAKGKIFCVSEIPDNLLMWSHYADSHQGVVIKFLCLPDIDNVLCAARKVNYQEDLPLLGTPEEIIEDILGLREPRLKEMWERLTLTKGISWSHEKEWRVIIPNYFHRVKHHFQPIEPVEISTIIFGCKISAEDRDEIRSILTAGLAHVQTFHAEKSNTSFGLDFSPID